MEPKSPPKISDISIGDVTEHEAKITFQTNVPTDALITYVTDDESKSGSQGKLELALEHEVTLSNLEPGTDFEVTVKVRDEAGNESEDEAGSFTTEKDESAPIIEQTKTDSALATNDKVQTIISWITNEPTTGSIIFKDGSSGQEKEIEVDAIYSQQHIAVVTEFKPGTVYYFKVKSVDQAGNETISQDFALLTPRRKENIVQIIISNFEDIFGWAKVN